MGHTEKEEKSSKIFMAVVIQLNLASLKYGAIVTVEKFPTRIKLFCDNEVLKLPESEELEACKYMPFISASKDNLCVGTGKKGLVKYVSSH